jgi:hypothetical protein
VHGQGRGHDSWAWRDAGKRAGWELALWPATYRRGPERLEGQACQQREHRALRRFGRRRFRLPAEMLAAVTASVWRPRGLRRCPGVRSGVGGPGAEAALRRPPRLPVRVAAVDELVGPAVEATLHGALRSRHRTAGSEAGASLTPRAAARAASLSRARRPHRYARERSQLSRRCPAPRLPRAQPDLAM